MAVTTQADQEQFTATLHRMERAVGSLATASMARMDETLPWFRDMPAEQRSWVMLIAQAGARSLVQWIRDNGERGNDALDGASSPTTSSPPRRPR